MEENLADIHWAIGRIVEIHPGSYGNVRVVSFKKLKDVIKKPSISTYQYLTFFILFSSVTRLRS